MVRSVRIHDTLTGLPELKPEKCALQSPDALLTKLLSQEPKPDGIGGCEACIDRFYEAYATQLAMFFLVCVLVAGMYGGFTANKRIWLLQALPAALALAALLLT